MPSGITVYRLPVTYYIATKIEALVSRGGIDWRGAKDFEDIVYVLNYCTEFPDVLESADRDIQKYLSEQFASFLRHPNISEEIECALPSEEIGRADVLIELLRKVASSLPNSLRVQYVSDLHLEFPQNRKWFSDHPLEVTGEILLIAGDTAYLDLPETKRDTYSQYQFWDWASDNYRQVIVCLGNHEFYGYYDLSTIPDGYCKTIRPNVRAYYNAVVNIGEADVIVSTLWSKIEPQNVFLTERNVSDFYRIMYQGHRLTSDDFNREHERCLQFVKRSVEESGAKKKIVLTHHVPTNLCTAEEFKESTINNSFTVELGNFIAKTDIDFWIYGHSHRNLEAQIGKTRIMSNQFGYYIQGEYLSNGFDPSRMVEI